jgi:hypothetical protein
MDLRILALLSLLTVSRIQTILIQIRILIFTVIQIRIRLSDTVPGPYCSEEVMYLPKTVLFMHLYLIFLVSRSARTQVLDIR